MRRVVRKGGVCLSSNGSDSGSFRKWDLSHPFRLLHVLLRALGPRKFHPAIAPEIPATRFELTLFFVFGIQITGEVPVVGGPMSPDTLPKLIPILLEPDLNDIEPVGHLASGSFDLKTPGHCVHEKEDIVIVVQETVVPESASEQMEVDELVHV